MTLDTHDMNGSPCPRCGTPKSAALAGNCPNCLIDLGTPDWPAAPAFLGTPGALPRLGDYELQEEIARGGMGVVYRARQLSLNRMVAVKVLIAGQFADETFLKRFRREAEAAAGLSHPNIVSIHEVGQHEGRPYFSMELIEGRNLSELIREKPLPARKAAQLLQCIAEAVHFAHEHGVLHRDLKPSNVLVDELGAPHITDFGLAKRLVGTRSTASDSSSEKITDGVEPVPADDLSITLTGQVLGSPNYMPPEQADPKRGPTTAASDVYSLGAILYHLVTGRPPFLADSVTQTLRLVAEGEPVSPRLLNPALSRDLETICSKCLEKEAPRRYSSARELAEELGRFLRDEPIRARPIGPLGRLARWRRRKPALATSLGAGALLLLIVVIGSPVALIRINRARTHAEEARARAESAERATEAQLYTALLEQARATVRSGEMNQRVRALDAIRRAAAISNTVELRREVFAALALPDLEFQRQLSIPSRFTVRVLDPTFERIAVCQHTQSVEIRAVSDQHLLTTLPAVTNRPAHLAEWSPDGRYLAIKRDHRDFGARADLEVWDVALERRILTRRNVTWGAMAFHPSAAVWMTAEPGDQVALWNLETGTELHRFQLPGQVQSLRFAPDGGRFAAVHGAAHRSGAHWVVSVFDSTNGAELVSHAFPKVGVAPVCWHPDGNWMVVPLGSGVVHWMDAGTGEIGEIGAHKAEATVAMFSPDGDYLISSSWDGEFICWDGRTRRRLFGIRLGSYVMQFRSGGGECSVLTDSGVQLHKLARPSAQRELTGHIGTRLRHAAFSPDGRWLAASSEKCAAVWDLTGQNLPAVDESGYEAHFYFTEDSRELFGSRSSTQDSAGYRWRLHPATNAITPPILERLPLGLPEGFSFLSVHSNRVVFTGARGSQMLGRNELESGSNHWAQTAPGVNAMSPDGRWLGVYRPFSSSVYVYRVPAWERVAKLTHSANISDFEFSPSGAEVAICSRTALEFWSTTSWQRTRVLTNLAGFGLFYGPDAQSFWLRRDQQAGLFDTRTLQPLLLLPDGMLPRANSADGRLLAVSVDGRRLQVWDLTQIRQELRKLGLDWNQDLPMAR